MRYINALFEYRSRLLIIRLDLSYESNTERKDKYKSHTKDEIDSWGQTARTHRNILIKKLGKQFKESFIGYVWKLEYGKDKGFHYHMIFFLMVLPVGKTSLLLKLSVNYGKQRLHTARACTGT